MSIGKSNFFIRQYAQRFWKYLVWNYIPKAGRIWKWNIIPKAGRIWEMEHNVRYGKIWLEIFGIGIKWKMRGVASLLWIYQFRHAPAKQFI